MPASYISSSDNSLLKEYIKLQNNRRYRQKTKQIALEGPNLVKEAIRAGLNPRAIFYSQDYYDQESGKWLNDLSSEVKQLVLTARLFKKIAETDTPQKVAGIFYFSEPAGQNIIGSRPQLVLILDRVQDPGNMGSIIRTAAATGVEVVYYTSGSVDPYSPKVLRSTAGAIFNLRLEQSADPQLLIRDLKKSGVQLVAASAKSTDYYWSVDYRLPTALIIGNEAGGIAEELVVQADFTVAIPLQGKVESLNAAVAGAVVLYEIIRQRTVQAP